MRRRVAILGSTGSIGTQALEILARHSDYFVVVGLAAGRNVDRLYLQQQRFAVQTISVRDSADVYPLQESVGQQVRVCSGREGLLSVALETQADIVLIATDGAVAFEAAFAAVERGIDLAVANKELIVAAGELLVPMAKARGVRIIPVDSEHSAIFQCLQGESESPLARLILTASGGPFRTWSADRMARATVQDALAHPTWSMGVKNSIDSATLMNKGLEVIEASRLFGLPGERIAVLVHPTSLVHGFVVFSDGNIKVQLAAPDMQLPIGYALAYPHRLVDPAMDVLGDPLAYFGRANGEEGVNLHFERVDHARFPALELAYQALKAGASVPCVLSAANEIAVQAFYEGKITFSSIAQTVAAVLQKVPRRELSLSTLVEVDLLARAEAHAYIERSSAAT